MPREKYIVKNLKMEKNVKILKNYMKNIILIIMIL